MEKSHGNGRHGLEAVSPVLTALGNAVNELETVIGSTTQAYHTIEGSWTGPDTESVPQPVAELHDRADPGTQRPLAAAPALAVELHRAAVGL